MPQGSIKKIVSDKGFGFIQGEGNADDMFFHMSEVQETTFDALSEGQAVEYEVGEGPKGPRATSVRPV